MNHEARSLRQAGAFGALVAPFVLTYAFVGGSQGHAFAFELLQDGDSTRWIEAVRAHPSGWKLTMTCLVAGFCCMLGCARCLFQGRGDGDWRRALSLLGYSVGVPAAIAAFAAQVGVMWWLSLTDEPLTPELLAVVDLTQMRYLAISFFVGPGLVVACGSGMMSWFALRNGLASRWVCWLGMLCGVFSILQMFRFQVPALGITSMGAGPLHMLWFTLFGISLLRTSPEKIRAVGAETQEKS